MIKLQNKQQGLGIKLILFTFFMLFVFVTLYFSIDVFLFCLIGIGLGVLVSPMLSYFQRKLSIPRGLSAVIFLLIFIILFAGVLYSIWYLISDQINGFIEKAPQLSKNLDKNLSSTLESLPWFKDRLKDLDITQTAKELATSFLDGLKMGAGAVTGLAFALVIGLYTAISLPDYFEAFIEAYPASKRIKAESIHHKCAKNLRLWFRAQAIDMAILGAITTIALWAVGVEFWAVYGLMTTLFTIVPYVGILFVVSCATLITLSSDPSLIVWVLGVFAVTQQIEANVILPLLMKGQVKLPEVPLLIFILVLGVSFGLIGIFIAPPLFAVLRVLYLEIYLPKVNQL